MSKQRKNNLINETSPYLLQHANNPVDWYAWNETALNKAVEEDKPILLSIGYSACHWCHVMAHESFEDDETAEIMNTHFINIKVDREERPDIDKIYQTAQQMLTQRTGGWPLTMFLTPNDHIPFFGGTYFPMESKFGLPGFKRLLTRIADFYREERDSIIKQNDSFLMSLQSMGQQVVPDEATVLNPEPLETATQQLHQSFDLQFGGFGSAPKFPHPSNLEHLLRQHLQTDCIQNQAINMVELTLDKMALGGLYDQLGGGFYRYSVDREWMIPHFEKMLYDNGLLLTLYSQIWQITKEPLYQQVAIGTADWVIEEMQSPEGGYYSSLDADSEGVEGKFYAWDKDEVKTLLSEQEFDAFAKHYGLDEVPNFEGQWHLRVMQETVDAEILQCLEQARIKLLQHRAKRVRPGCDDKVLTSWNALMIKGMATAAFTFNNDRYLESAEKALEFIHQKLYSDGKLLATYREGKAHLNAYLDDYAFLIDAILSFLQYRWDQKWLVMAIQLADQILDSFEDKEHGGFFFTSHDHEKLIQRSKSFMDDSLPSGNGVAASVLGKLGHLLGDSRYLKASESALRAAWSSIERYPSAHNALLHALDENISPAKRVILIGETESMTEWLEKYRETHNPFNNLIILPKNVAKLPGILREYKTERLPVAYICEGHSCQEPIFDLDLIGKTLNNHA
ncbi:MAG: hypothetical protein ACI9ZT_001796 [Gammaproteobacteria bacterium]|jgi:uncharacterized protein YyaL (SSP411 family)